MPLVCASCRKSIPEGEETPRFCPFCGIRLPESSVQIPVSPRAETTVSLPLAVNSPSEQTPGSETNIPTFIGGYRILSPLGVGGMGQVFEAESPSGEKVALKLLSSQFASNPISLERFRQEGRLAGQIAHPRCVFVINADTDNGRPYIVMEKMPGRTLKDLLDERGPLPPQEAIRYTLEMIEGLEQAHRLGVIHRDVKPSNCFLTEDGRIKIGDFGLSKSLTSTTQLTQSGAFLGTVLYSSPEQIRGEGVDFTSDVYSTCVTLFQMLTGRTPFQHENVTAVLAMIISDDPPEIRSIRRDIPASLARIVHRGLERDRTYRWQSLGELKQALEALVPSKLTFGGMGIRIAAYLSDELLLSILILLFAILPDVPWHRPLLSLIYFTLIEGVLGYSIGKWLFGMRVCRTGTTDPPGLKRAAIRTLVFTLLFIATSGQFLLLIQTLQNGDFSGNALWRSLAFLLGTSILVLPMRRSNDFLGMHEALSGTCVMRLPRRPRSIRLRSLRGDPLHALPLRTEGIPELIGPYAIRRAASAGNDRLLIGEDQVLGRRVLIRLKPAGEKSPRVRLDGGRTSRLRPLNSGGIRHQTKDWHWEAFVAPDGFPLSDVVSPTKRLQWAETRLILEHLVGELQAAKQEKSLPSPLSVDLVWVQGDGHLQLLDFPLSSGETASDEIALIRQTASLALEGQVRTGNSPIAAAIPRHAAAFLRRTSEGPNRFTDISACQEGLFSTREQPLEVNRMMRLAHLGIQAVFLLIPMGMMLILSGVFAAGLNGAEPNPFSLTPQERESLVREYWQEVAAVTILWPLLWIFWAFLFRGGISFLLSSITIVDVKTGDPITRRKCTVRALLVWLPIGLAAAAGVGIRGNFPEASALAMSVWWIAPGLLVLWWTLALLLPRRAPHDRWLGTILVPR